MVDTVIDWAQVDELRADMGDAFQIGRAHV